jgi:L-lactate dehydrogenase complex protein LldG
MSSRVAILDRIAKNKPQHITAPDISVLENTNLNPNANLDQFCVVATSIGAKVILINSLSEVKTYIQDQFPNQRVISSIPELFGLVEDGSLLVEAVPHELENVELAIIRAEFGVAENGALWVTAAQMGTRVLPFITQHLAIIVKAEDIVSDLHAAYKRSAGSDHDFAAFIAGPSKTADIEQSLVLGAHGSRSLVIFIVNN